MNRFHQAALLADPNDPDEIEAAEWLLGREWEWDDRGMVNGYMVSYIGASPPHWLPKLAVACRLLDRLNDVNERKGAA